MPGTIPRPISEYQTRKQVLQNFFLVLPIPTVSITILLIHVLYTVSQKTDPYNYYDITSPIHNIH